MRCSLPILLILALDFDPTLPAHELTKDQVHSDMKRAAVAFHKSASNHGGYVYYSDTKFENWWGEGKFTKDTIFVQPPGTPSVGMTFLKAYQVTGDEFYLGVALEAAEALRQGQLKSGGWPQMIDFGPAVDQRSGDYRFRQGGNRNVSSLDDDQTQAALSFLMQLDQELDFENEKVHECVEYGLNALLKAQFPNGGFPQVWREPVAEWEILKASYPEYDWRTERRVKNYWDYYTLNDGLAGTVSRTLQLAHEVYGEEQYLEALKRLGDFLILAQMPEPQPAWCQQYNEQMHPMWARKFEPPAIVGHESQDVMATLIRIYEYTKEERYLKPIPAALKYFEEECLLEDGRSLARFYELKTNRPLYMDQQYQLTYDDSNPPSHYGWKQSSRIQKVRQQYERAIQGDHEKSESSPGSIRRETERILKSLNSDGFWISKGDGKKLTGKPNFQGDFYYVSSRTFNQNLATLCEFLKLNQGSR